MNQEKLNKLQNSVRIGGKGSVRRKSKVVRKKATATDQKLQNALKKLSASPFQGIEEVNLFHEDGTITHFKQPKVQVAMSSNTFVVSGNAEKKQLQELLPGIINQLGPDALTNLKKLADSFAKAGLNVEGDVPNLAEDDAVPDLAEAPAAAEPAATEATADRKSVV